MSTTAQLHIEQDESGILPGCVTVWMEQPGSPVVVLNESLLNQLEEAFKSVPRDAKGLVLASASERVFVAGADLKTIQALDDKALLNYLQYGQRVFGMLCEMPCWTAAAINGAALGGGLEVAMHCDGLIGAPSPTGKPYAIGLPEAGLGICPGWGGTNLLPARLDPSVAISRTAAGKPMNYTDAEEYGVFDAVAETPETLLDTAKLWLKEYASKHAPVRDGMPSKWIGRPGIATATIAGLLAAQDDLPDTDAARCIVKAIKEGLETGWTKALEIERIELTRLRNTPEGKAAIEAFFNKT